MKHQRIGPINAINKGLIDQAIAEAQADFAQVILSHGLEVEQLDHPDELTVELNRDLAYNYHEERQLLAGMIQVYAKRGLPELISRSRFIEVEGEHVAPLGKAATIRSESFGHSDHLCVISNLPIHFMSRPDAVLLTLDGDIETLSLKTTAAWNDRKQRDAEHDMQNLSEPWGVDTWLRDVWHRVRAGVTRGSDATDMDPNLCALLKASPYPPIVATTRMLLVLAGERREVEPGRWASVSPLVRGYRRSIGGLRYEYAWSPYWRCSEPHPMRKSSWYPDARCPGDGRRHKLPDDFEPFAVWQDDEIGGVAGWVDRLDRGLVQPEAGDALGQQIVTLPPIARHRSDIERWHRQVSAQEAQVAEDSWRANRLLEAGRLDELEQLLDEHFPMHTRACDYPGRCPFQELCWNPEAARDPLATGLYILRPPHHVLEREQQEREALQQAA